MVSGANLGDRFGALQNLELSDQYMLARGAHILPLTMIGSGETDHLWVADDSTVGQSGARLALDCYVTMMQDTGETIDALTILETTDDEPDRLYLMVFGELVQRATYTLINLNTQKLSEKLAETACVSFIRGTGISLANGTMVNIEDLRPGDRVLTRDRGAQSIRWIGQQTVRATGAFAPIRIAQGTLNNERDLILAPDHRLFIYRRDNSGNAKGPEVMIKAKLLVNGNSVVQATGGFVDYFQLLFDQHEIIFAEGIAAESLFLADHKKPAVPTKVQDSLGLGRAQSDLGRDLDIGDDAPAHRQAARILDGLNRT